MNRLIKWCIAASLVFPLLASAQTIRVNATATGMISPESEWLRSVSSGAQMPVGAELPFTLSLTVDLDDPSETDNDENRYAFQTDAPGAVTITVNGNTFTRTQEGFFFVQVDRSLFTVDFRFVTKAGHT